MNADELKGILRIRAEGAGLQLNPDAAVVDRVIAGLIKRNEKLGEFYCPCRVLKGTDEDDKVICPCVYLEDDVERDGRCHCNLFVKKEG